MYELVKNINKLHTTEFGAERIKKNLQLETDDVVEWCREKIENADSVIKNGKNLYVRTGTIQITIHAQSYTIITAHREIPRKGDSMDGVDIIKKIDDIPELKEALIAVFNEKSHRQVSQYGLLLAEHILSLTNTPYDSLFNACFEVNKRWQEGKARFQEARNVADLMLQLARSEKNPKRVKVLRVMAQVAATPHVKRHALIASDYAITLINTLYPKDLDAVRKEREEQIRLMESV